MRLFKNKKAVSLLTISSAVIVFSFFMVSLWFVYADMAVQYGVPVNGSFSEPFDEVNETFAIANEVGQKFDESEAQSTNAIVTFISDGVASLKIMFKVVNIIPKLVSATSDVIGIPEIATTMFLAIVVLSIVFGLVTILVKTPI